MINLTSTPTLAKAMGAFVGRIGHEAGAESLAEVDQSMFALFKYGFDDMGPYHFAKLLGVLRNGSGEDLAVEFMGTWNREIAVVY